ncbi:MAG: tRNA (guanosine(46)-N7)-methyltransferase TrmB [Bacteroidales bacterium]|nr:tRNA (guanosine(46)-N7)-methyltransferase TrmB [Bacteroidales bacterium]MBQ6689001.1 tRNA (guanosine(46)-N7)-methyltransferase TrmB [Bacteroidales bacterium]
MGKDKLRKFRENETFRCMIQPETSEVLNRDHALKGNWGRDFFGNDNPIVLELGCGKGEYTVDLAMRNPSCNYIGVDIKGARLWKGAKYAEEHRLGNVAFLRTRIEFIESLFAEGEISEIWITFADPQIGREKKRLTSPLFMRRYRNFLKRGGIVHLKTDSRYLHEYSYAMAMQNDLKILACAKDIYGEDRERLYESELLSVCGRDAVEALFEVQTFYESQYLAQGILITYLSFLADHEGDYKSPEWEEDRWKDEGHHFLIPSGLPVASKFYPEL